MKLLLATLSVGVALSAVVISISLIRQKRKPEPRLLGYFDGTAYTPFD